MKIQAMIGGMLVMLGCAWPAIGSEKAAPEQCRPSGELKFLCGINKPEDVVALPGGRWVISSGMTVSSGLHLIDGQTKKWQRWIAPAGASPRGLFAKCPSQPVADEMQLHGLSLRQRGPGRATLYAVNHGGREKIEDMSGGRGRETIEVFNVDATGAKPRLTWIGCVPMPGNLVANGVVSGPDGSIYATVMLHPNYKNSDLFKGIKTGAVYKWRPGMATFERMAGTELTGNNGIEVSPDGKTLYVNSIQGITMFTNTNPAKRLRSVEVKGAFADNLHWVNGRLVLAGPRTDLCPPSASGAPCMAGYFVSTVNPKTLALTPLAKGGVNPEFSGASAAIPVGKTLWIGSYSADRLAYRTLP